MKTTFQKEVFSAQKGVNGNHPRHNHEGPALVSNFDDGNTYAEWWDQGELLAILDNGKMYRCTHGNIPTKSAMEEVQVPGKWQGYETTLDLFDIQRFVQKDDYKFEPKVSEHLDRYEVVNGVRHDLPAVGQQVATPAPAAPVAPAAPLNVDEPPPPPGMYSGGDAPLEKELPKSPVMQTLSEAPQEPVMYSGGDAPREPVLESPSLVMPLVGQPVSAKGVENNKSPQFVGQGEATPEETEPSTEKEMKDDPVLSATPKEEPVVPVAGKVGEVTTSAVPKASSGKFAFSRSNTKALVGAMVLGTMVLGPFGLVGVLGYEYLTKNKFSNGLGEKFTQWGNFKDKLFSRREATQSTQDLNQSPVIGPRQRM